MNLPDQKQMWEKKHAAGKHDHLISEHSTLAETIAKKLPAGSTLLELGCGVGRDAAFFAGQGFNVIATDFAESVITKNKTTFANTSAVFEIVDMQQPLPFADASFNCVYAYFSLHYYTEEVTQDIFEEITRILKPEGLFAFACKSYDEVRMNNAKIVAKDVYVDQSGHALHAFSVGYVKELVGDHFAVVLLEEKTETYNSRESSVVSFIGIKK